jgi:hypothetical protein
MSKPIHRKEVDRHPCSPVDRQLGENLADDATELAAVA